MEIILAARLRISLLLDEEQREDVGEKQGSGEKGEGRSCSQRSVPVPALQQNNYPSNYPSNECAHPVCWNSASCH